MKTTISGIRGIFGDDFTLREVLEFCNNFSVLVKSKKCIIGQDTRPSGQMVKEIASAALMQNGINIFDLGMAPTPVVFHESRKYGAGIVVTSSHNPLEWNGLKFIIDGRGINESELPTILEKQEISKSAIGREEKILSTYLEDAQKIVGKVQNTPKIALDIGGGAARNFAPKLLQNLGCKVDVINSDLQNCNRGPDPTSDSLGDLVSCSADKDIGFAFDLDGDRLVVVKDGKKQTPDVTLGLGVAKSLELGYKKFVLSIDTSVSIEKFIKQNGGTVQRSKVGEANVIDLMIKSGSQAGGEGSSAGFILPEFNFCRDGILTGGLIATILGTNQFNDVLDFMENYTQIRDKTKVPSSLHEKVMEKVSNKLEQKFSEVITLDGTKGIVDEDSWVLIRKSNTEDIIRISAESNNAIKCNNIVKESIDLVNQCYEQVR
ncbi:MAG: phosphomannomutase [Nitrosopumilaceae archaeon]|nr:phosphomannomutase [Nitrosopumilaceae archaeon]